MGRPIGSRRGLIARAIHGFVYLCPVLYCFCTASWRPRDNTTSSCTHFAIVFPWDNLPPVLFIDIVGFVVACLRRPVIVPATPDAIVIRSAWATVVESGATERSRYPPKNRCRADATNWCGRWRLNCEHLYKRIGAKDARGNHSKSVLMLVAAFVSIAAVWVSLEVRARTEADVAGLTNERWSCKSAYEPQVNKH